MLLQVLETGSSLDWLKKVYCVVNQRFCSKSLQKREKKIYNWRNLQNCTSSIVNLVVKVSSIIVNVS